MSHVLPFPPPPALASVHAARLAERHAEQRPRRRWVRHHPDVEVPTTVAMRPGTLVDLSYGGACVTFSGVDASVMAPGPDAGAPESFDLTIPGYGVSVPVEAVWSHTARGQLGLAVRRDGASDAVWRAFVDAVTAGPDDGELALAAA